MTRIAGAVVGGLAAGVALSAMMLVGERLSGKPSELIELERKAAARLGTWTPPADEPATVTEQVVTHSGHLALSVLAGVAYAAMVNEDTDGLKSGAAFGLAFFIVAYGVTGPALGITPLPWREQPLRAVQHPVVHAMFGVAMALAAREAHAD